MQLFGNYNLEVKIGDVFIPVQPQMIEELTISQDIDRLIPTFTFRLKDATSLLGLVVPHDRNSNTVSLTISREQFTDKRNEFNFDVKRRRVLSSRSYEMDGLLNTTGLLAPPRSRSLTGNLKSNIESIASEELGIAETDIGQSLSFVKTIIQPRWTNAYLFRYLKDRIKGKSGETCFYCFIKNVAGTPTLVFKSIEELLFSEISYKFVIGPNSVQDYFPVSDFRIFDNSQFRAIFCSKSSQFSYFDYSKGTYVDTSTGEIGNCPSLSEYYLVDDDNNTNMGVPYLGRNNDFTEDFQGRMGQSFFDSVNESVHMWISTWGIEDIAPGDIVRVLFSEALNRGNLFVYQHSGNWMVRRVVHIIGSSFMSNVLLTRCGIDTDIETTLSPANEIRK